MSSDSADQLNSFASQVAYYTKQITANPDYELVDIYADKGISGLSALKRDEFHRLLTDCRTGKIDCIITKSVSRFSRSVEDTLTFARELKSLNVSIYFESNDLDTGSLTGELNLSILARMAEEESMNLSRNMRWSYQKRMRSGQFITCKAPYGYRLVDGELVPDEQESHVVREIFAKYISGTNIEYIADELTQRAVPKRESLTWHAKTITQILRNERYIGDAILQKYVTTEHLPFKQLKNNGTREQYKLTGSHAVIINEQIFIAANDLLAKRSAHKSSTFNKYIFTSKLYCAKCGSPYKRKLRAGRITWGCTSHLKSADICRANNIDEDILKTAFTVMCTKLQSNIAHTLLPMRDQLEQLQQRINGSNITLSDFSRQLTELTEQNLALTRLNTKGYIDSAIFMQKSAEINNKIAELRRRRKQVVTTDDTLLKATDIIISVIEKAEISSFNSDIFNSIVRKVTVSDDAVTFLLINNLSLMEER